MIEDGSHFPEEVSVVESEQDPIFSNLRLKEKVQRLQAVVEDLNRRIQNSNYIIESEKKVYFWPYDCLSLKVVCFTVFITIRSLIMQTIELYYIGSQSTNHLTF